MTTRTAGRWLDDHEDNDDDAPGDGDALWERPRQTGATRFVPRIGVSGLERDVTRAFAAHLVTWSVSIGRAPLIIATDATDSDGWESAAALRHALSGVLDGACIVGLITESMDRPGARMLLNAVATELLTRYPDTEHASRYWERATGRTAPRSRTRALHRRRIRHREPDGCARPPRDRRHRSPGDSPTIICCHGTRSKGKPGDLLRKPASARRGRGLHEWAGSGDVFTVLWDDVLGD